MRWDFDNGIGHGAYLSFDDPDGNKLMEGAFTHGQRTGIWFVRLVDGSIQYWDYDNNKPVPDP